MYRVELIEEIHFRFLYVIGHQELQKSYILVFGLISYWNSYTSVLYNLAPREENKEFMEFKFLNINFSVFYVDYLVKKTWTI